MKKSHLKIISVIIFLITINSSIPVQSFAKTAALIPRDSILLTDPSGRILYSKNASVTRAPASTLKVLTSLASLNILGDDFSFQTKFYMNSNGTLTIQGFGDPLLLSEEIKESAKILSKILTKEKNTVRQIVLDGTYFETPIRIPGVTEGSTQPYDAPNGALNANFNTVMFDTAADGSIVSPEPQTPFLPYLTDRVTKSGLSKGRINLAGDDSSLYAGYLYKFFLKQSGTPCEGAVSQGPVGSKDTLIYTYVSKYSLSEVIQKMLKYSNNYMANQLLLTVGVKKYGPPGNLEKGVKALLNFSTTNLGLENIELIEGSGISRGNLVSAQHMTIILNAFSNYRHLLKTKSEDAYKTGTLKGIRTRIGFIKSTGGEYYRYAIMTDEKNRHMEQILHKLKKIVKDNP